MSADGVAVPVGGLWLREVSVGPMDNRAYLLSSASSSRTPTRHLLIDAAAEPERLLALLAEAAGQAGDLETVVTTHRHPDHTGALVAVLSATGARHVAGDEDADHLPAPVAVRLRHGDVLDLAGVTLEVIALRGHTPGSVALLLAGDGGPAHLFTGDSLFPGGPGRTTSPADFTSLMDDLVDRVFARLDDEVVVHPGHGESTTLGRERPHLEEWRARGW